MWVFNFFFQYDIEYIHQLVYDLSINELQFILEGVKQNKCGSKQSLRKRVLNLLSASSSKTRTLKQKIVQVYKSRAIPPIQQSQRVSIFCEPQPRPTINNFVQRMPTTYCPFTDNDVPSCETPPESAIEFEHLPFFKTMQTLLSPMHCNTEIDVASFTGLFYLKDNVRHSIAKSWNIVRQEYQIEIILRLVQVGLKENVTERLPYNINVSVNDRPCKLPVLNIPTKAGITPWRCNVPIDITQQTDLRSCLQNKLQITWSDEPHQYMAGVFVAQKLTWDELLEQLKTRPVRPADKTRELIKKSMESDVDMGVDSMLTTVKDPLSKMRMEMPARGMDCIHLSCFDAIQFLQMNEQKQTWLCPICKKKVKFENIEVDEFFLNILKSPNLSKDCENVVLLQDGSWTEKQTKEYSSSSTSNDKQSANNIEVFTLSDSDDEDDMPILKRLNKDQPKVEKPIIKSEHIVNVEDLTKTNDINSLENDLVLDLSFKNSPSTSSEYQPITLNDNSDHTHQPPPLLRNMYFPGITITESNNGDYKPCSSRSSRNNNLQDKETSRAVLCVITLD